MMNRSRRTGLVRKSVKGTLLLFAVLAPSALRAGAGEAEDKVTRCDGKGDIASKSSPSKKSKLAANTKIWLVPATGSSTTG